MYRFFILKFCYLFGFLLIARISKTIAQTEDTIVDRGNIKLNMALYSTITFVFRLG